MKNMSRNKYAKLVEMKNAPEKDYSRRKEFGKFCLDMAKITYTGVLTANVVSYINDTFTQRNWYIIGLASLMAVSLIVAGCLFLNINKKNK